MSKRPGSFTDPESAGKKQKIPPVECPICWEEFEIPTKNDQLRILPCTDAICHECLVKVIDTQGHMSSITCPRCQQPQPLFVDPYGQTTPSVLAELFPTRAKYTQALKRNESLLEQKETITNPCSICHKEATDICLVCGYQCAQHSESSHAKWSNHVHQSVQLAAERKQKQEEAEQISLRGSRAARELKRIRAKWSDRSANCVERKKEFAHCLKLTEAEITIMTKLQVRVSDWVDQLKSRKELLTSMEAESDHQRKMLLEMQQSKINEINYLLKLTSNERVGKMDQLNKLVNIDQILKASEKLENDWEEKGPIVAIPHPAIEFTRQQSGATILPTLVRESFLKLNEFLQPTSKTISSRSPMIYKASWHGWTKAPFLQCCAGKSSLVILVKEASSGYVFGAYIEPVWPDDCNGDGAVMPDPSMKSFLFSLTNPWDIEIRLLLTDPNSAVDLSTTSVGFGKPMRNANGEAIGEFNFELFCCGRPANALGGIYVSEQNDQNYAYQLAVGSTPPAFEMDSYAFGGDNYLHAEEIEVYQI